MSTHRNDDDEINNIRYQENITLEVVSDILRLIIKLPYIIDRARVIVVRASISNLAIRQHKGVECDTALNDTELSGTILKYGRGVDNLGFKLICFDNKLFLNIIYITFKI